ncbi:MAG: CHRD domain-containing protein [Planctomycetes bacterium]|nr:CHRD domain-containing protein [Planctomycetota bacterium]
MAASAFANGIYHRVALLMGDQETPAVSTAALGAGTFLVDTCANTVTYYITYSCLSSTETAAHIHGPAAPGVAGGVLFPLATGNVKTGVWNYPEALESAILDGRTYVNVHSAIFPGGELRGQIVAAVALLDG